MIAGIANGLKNGGTARILKTLIYNTLHLSPHSVQVVKMRSVPFKKKDAENQ